jgi:hypothetical protein
MDLGFPYSSLAFFTKTVFLQNIRKKPTKYATDAASNSKSGNPNKV